MAHYFIIRDENRKITSLGYGDRGEACTRADYVEAMASLSLANMTKAEIAAMERGDVTPPPALSAVIAAARKELGNDFKIEIPEQSTKP